MIKKQEAKEVLENLRTEENFDRIEKYVKMIDSMSDNDMEKILAQARIVTIDDFKKEIQRKISIRESTNFTSLNDIVSYGYSGNTIHIHLLPKDGKFLLNKDGLKMAELKLIEALEQLKSLILTDDNLKNTNQIYAVSGLIKRPISTLFTNLGFDVKTMKIEKAKEDSELKKFYDRFKDKKDIGRAILPTKILFSPKWEDLKNERKQELQTQLKESMVKVISKDEITGLEKIGEGKCASIYKKGKEVYKILNQKSDSIRFYNKDMLENLVGIKSDICVFPNKILEDNDGNLLGYSMDYIKGENFQTKIKDLTFEELQNIFKEAEESIEKISEQGIIFDDMHSGNIMWGEENRKIKIIDTDFFKKTNEPQKINILKFNSAIRDMLYPYIAEYGITVNQELKSFYNINSLTSEDGKILLPSEFIMKIKHIMEKDLGKEFKNLGEVEKSLQQKQEDEQQEIYDMQQKLQNDIENKPIVKRAISKGKKLLDALIDKTKKKTRTGMINKQVEYIENIEKSQKNRDDKTNETKEEI